MDEGMAYRRSMHVLIIALSILAMRPAGAEFAVGVVPSDEETLAAPAPRDLTLTADQILAMVRRAVDLIGGMASVVPDTARLVAIKTNISTIEPSGSGVITEARVVRAVALLVHEAVPEARILIVEGAGGWISPSHSSSIGMPVFSDMVQDGFAVAGHRATVDELRGLGVDIDCFDLNFDRAYTMQVPGGGLATDEYDIAAALIDADVWINCPVAKTHGAKITCCMKNHFGILPGRIYGWNKARGTQDHAGMPHAPRVVDEAWVDLWTLSQMDLNVVDMIVGSEAGAFEKTVRRSNIVLAGRDPVATDLVVAKLMGFNPDDFEFAELAWRRGMGPHYIENVDIRGAEVERLVARYKKAGVDYSGRGEWAEHANYGMGPRYWTLLGPLPKDHAFGAAEIAGLAPEAGKGDWSEVIFFGHDKIDLDKHYDDPVNCAVYAFTRFTMARADSVRLWIGSDEDLQIWIDGEPLYEYGGRRRHRLGMVQLPAYLEAGEHRLLLRAQQGRGDFSFSFNICEPIDDVLYAGNRYPGVRYYLDSQRDQVAALQVRAENVGGDFSSSGVREMNAITLENAYDPLERSRSAPDSLLLHDVPPPTRRDLMGLMAERAGIGQGAFDEVALEVLSTVPFTLGHLSIGWEGYYPDYGPELARLLNWLGLRYAVTYGYGRRESLKTIQGWLAGGRLPLTSDLVRRRGRRRRGRQPTAWGQVTGYRILFIKRGPGLV